MSDFAGRHSQVDWAAVLAGAVLATAIGLILTGFGLGIGLAANSPYEGEGVSPGLFVFGAGLWVLAVQVLSFWIGGYVCARLRTRQIELTEHEVDVRDSLHGLLVWGTGVIAAAFIAFFVLGGLTAASENARGGVATSVTQSVDAEVDQAASAERATNPEAGDETLAERRAEVVRKAGVISSFITAASLLAGAVAAFFAALAGGHHRDKSVQVKFFMTRRVVTVASPTPMPPP